MMSQAERVIWYVYFLIEQAILAIRICGLHIQRVRIRMLRRFVLTFGVRYKIILRLLLAIFIALCYTIFS
jgi:hypothetical protein